MASWTLLWAYALGMGVPNARQGSQLSRRKITCFINFSTSRRILESDARLPHAYRRCECPLCGI
jgi:hypothetical protein